MADEKNPKDTKGKKKPQTRISIRRQPMARPRPSDPEKRAPRKPNPRYNIKIKTPKEIDSYLSQFVIGQEQARRSLALAGYYHLRYLEALSRGVKGLTRSNVMLIGPTGSGKTLLVKHLSDILELPFQASDCSSFTAAGYYGKDADSCLNELISRVEDPTLNFRGGVVFLDEIDKIARTSHGGTTSGGGTKDIGGESVQQQLLKIVEGSEVEIKATRSIFGGEPLMVDTSRILFVAAGAFSDLHDVRKMAPPKRVGFANPEPVKEESKEIDVTDLIKAGMLPEFMGRFPILVQLTALTRNQLLQVMTEARGSVINEFRNRLALDNIELKVRTEALEMIADYAISRQVGARGLKAIMEKVFFEVLFNAPSNPDTTFTLDEAYVQEKLDLRAVSGN
jgi:ATP-dependent Clp protease ATP-binding subunit ClpX